MQDMLGLPLSVLQTPWMLALLGFVQHVFIAYLLLEHVFQLSFRHRQAQRHVANMPTAWRFRRAAVFAQAVAPPLSLVLGLMILLQNATLAAPTFLTIDNALIDARSFFERQGPPLLVRVTAATIVAVAGAAALALLYWLGVMVGRLSIKLASHSRFATNVTLPSARARASHQSYLYVIFASAVVQVVVTLAVLIMLVDRLWRDSGDLSLTASIGLLKATLLSPGVRAAIIAVALVWSVGIWYRSTRPQPQRPDRLMMICAIVAFTPSALLASIALPLLSAATQAALLWSLLVLWTSAIATFMFFHVIAMEPHPILLNLRLLNARPSRYFCGALLSSFGGLAPSALVVAYVLWIEDGLQVTLRPADVTVTSLLYRSMDGRWSPTSLLAIILGFVFWGLVLIVLRAFSSSRSALARLLIDSKPLHLRRVGFVLVGLALALPIPVYGAEMSPAGSIPLRYTARGHVITAILPAVNNLRISEMVVDNDSTVELHVPEVVKNITIERLHFTSATLPVIRFTGKRQQLLEQLAIRHIQFDVTSRDDAVLQLSGLFVDDLQITGDSCNGAGPNLNVPRISIEMSEEASLRGASLTCLPTSAIDLAVARRPGDPNLLASITIIQSNLVLAHIHGPSATADAGPPPSGTVEINATMSSDASRGDPQLNIDSLDWRGGEITLKPAREQEIVLVSLAHVDRTGPTTTSLRLKDFPRAELRWENGQLDGDTTIEATALDNLVLDHLRRGTGTNLSRLKINANSYNGVALSNLAVDQLEIFAAPRIHSPWLIKTVQSVSVDEHIAIPRDFLESVLKYKVSPLQARHFITTLRDYGQYSDDNHFTIVGLDAVYKRKIIDLQDVSRPAAALLDISTGLGIRLSKPLVTWLAYTFVYLVVSTSLTWKYSRKLPTGHVRRFATSCGHVFVSLVASTSMSDIANRTARTALLACRNIYRFCFVLQLTILSIYLSQTALS
jgi:hypothetical protein